MQRRVEFATERREVLIDITASVEEIVQASGVQSGVICLYAQGATGGIMIQENWDESVQDDVIAFLQGVVPRGVWRHDQQDGNGDAHIKAGMVGPSETIPILDGRLGLSRWQNIFFCEFDGPRRKRTVIATLLVSQDE